MKLLFAIILFFLTSYCVAQKEITKSTFSKDNFIIEYPKSWRIDTSRLMGTEFFLFAPLENQTDKFSENVNLIIQDLTGQNVNLETYKSLTDKQISEFTNKSKVFESLIKKAKNRDYFKVVYTITQGKSKLMITSICIIKNEKAYLLTFTTELERYELYKKTGEQILNSFFVTR